MCACKDQQGNLPQCQTRSPSEAWPALNIIYFEKYQFKKMIRANLSNWDSVGLGNALEHRVVAQIPAIAWEGEGKEKKNQSECFMSRFSCFYDNLTCAWPRQELQAANSRWTAAYRIFLKKKNQYNNNNDNKITIYFKTNNVLLLAKGDQGVLMPARVEFDLGLGRRRNISSLSHTYKWSIFGRKKSEPDSHSESDRQGRKCPERKMVRKPF